ncbi:cytochrome P450 [Diaminobutyricimonas sp. TR449]|uniref:cytochrome P450 n=1 Tax=Diaminobutyricimonas sp. TR449 TaxID=2708076 RepID=UPI00141E9F85|nr:cytochrome P450 [Diaminobutyricimonas sp. TR449]
MVDTTALSTTLDVFSNDVTGDPELLKELRDIAPAVWVPEHQFWLLSRYDIVRGAAMDWQTYSSAEGVALLPDGNAPVIGAIIATDPPQHDVIRGVLAAQTSPRAITALREQIADEVDDIVAAALEQPTFDGVELAQSIPRKIVGDLIGIPSEPRAHLFEGADAVNYTFGPASDRLKALIPIVIGYVDWIASVSNRQALRPGSWGAAILDAVDAGILDERSGQLQINALLVAGLDTTSNALGSLLRLVAEQPEVWEAMKRDPSLVKQVFEETLRMWSPVRGFFRLTTRDVDVEGVTIPAGSRVLLNFLAANRDERHYDNPDIFDINRNPTDHLSFGYGLHGCVGQAVARLEAHSLINSLLKRVDRFELAGQPAHRQHPLINGLSELPLRAQLATTPA